MIWEIVVKKMNFKLFFVESVCDDPSIVETNIMVNVYLFLLEHLLLNFEHNNLSDTPFVHHSYKFIHQSYTNYLSSPYSGGESEQS